MNDLICSRERDDVEVSIKGEFQIIKNKFEVDLGVQYIVY